ncbi:hydroxyacylglutathione hydrolase [Panacagrimonas perspica]|uniref:Hydroxyacylglutathione hydrolase n=1 Tax=Panacagrimonas perspica TaxID=381431 RepID=A0A4R7P4J4_9GAMM|nr:MBL fold metallo-hydrolase [Panacagrimonas perspica]TDU28319.1 hydroxyacylglutathione hydrolase [Panacagrimonas perspica]
MNGDIGLQACAHGIHAIDSGYVRPRLDAIHLIVEKGRAAFVDTGTGLSVPRMLEALARLGLGVDAVDYVILTHVHLDHAGGAGLLMRSLPHATAVVHPRGAPHMLDPSKVWAATLEVYGEERARRDYGELVPIPRERLIEGTDGSSVSLAGRKLTFIDTPGHAKHHFCVHDEQARAIFAGDTFGISYRELDQGGEQFIFPSTTPTQFDPPALHASIDKLLALQPRAIYLTHYSEITGIPQKGVDLHRLVEAHAQLGLQWEGCADAAQRAAGLAAGVERMAIDEARRVGGDPAQWTQVLDNDIALNAQGIGSWLDFRKSKRG